jgi:outer membrane biogenesis lipoprotein LolB
LQGRPERSKGPRLGTTAAAVCLLAAGCATTAPRAPSARGGAALQLPADAWAHQHLFRISYSGAGRDGSGRLTLYLDRPGRYLLRAVDPLGRTAWTLEAADDGFLLVDERAGIFCRGARALELTELDLGPLPPDSVPAVLLGHLPVAAPSGALAPDGSLSFRDGEGRRWTGRVGERGLAAWTLHRDGEAWVWWTRDGDGGILSHRRGEQFRWRRAVSEPLAVPPPPLAPPDGSREIACDGTDLQELRQGQPPPGGGGTEA